jgi:adenylate cyclase
MAGRIVKTTGDGMLVEIPSVVDTVRYAIQVQEARAGRNSGIAAEERIELRIDGFLPGTWGTATS